MAHILLGATGSVAAIRVPELYRQLRLAGHAVKVVATRAALYFFDPALLDPTHPERPERNPAVVVLDEDEWPGRERGQLWQRDDPVLHIELRKWADLFAIAPLDANTLAKLANGLSDNCLTCVWRAWDTARPVVLAPAMNTLMWLHPLTGRHLRQLAVDCGGGDVPAGLDLDGVVAWINEHCPRLRIVAPQSKRLACGDVGVGARADVAEVVAAVDAAL
jgi:phosphopantothenoylcysteine decarboxylase